MPFEKGHTINVRLKTPEIMIEAYQSYCDHIAQGYPQKAWCFEHPETSLHWETMEKYIRENPNILDPLHKKIAQAKSLRHWFSFLGESAKGSNVKANVASLQIILRNMHAWDAKDQVRETDTSSTEAAEKVLEQLATMQKNNGNSPTHREEISS